MNNNMWNIIPPDNDEWLHMIFDFLKSEYSRIFGEKTMTKEPCTIYNDPVAECPMLIINYRPILIRLALPTPRDWNRAIFQLSHELCHYAIRQYKIDKEFTLSWFEELICEAMSLYTLKYSSQNWEKCKLYGRDPNWASTIENYLNNELTRNATTRFSECTTIELLHKYEKSESTKRETHINERNILYRAILVSPMECRHFCEYQAYVNPNTGVTIDFSKWERDNPCQLIKQLHKLQPCCEGVS